RDSSHILRPLWGLSGPPGVEPAFEFVRLGHLALAEHRELSESLWTALHASSVTVNRHFQTEALTRCYVRCCFLRHAVYIRVSWNSKPKYNQKSMSPDDNRRYVN